MFPFAEYKSVVLSESEARKVRAEAMILNFERDSEDGENFLIAVKFMGQCDASLFEDGTVSQEGEGAFHGEIRGTLVGRFAGLRQLRRSGENDAGGHRTVKRDIGGLSAERECHGGGEHAEFGLELHDENSDSLMFE